MKKTKIAILSILGSLTFGSTLLATIEHQKEFLVKYPDAKAKLGKCSTCHENRANYKQYTCYGCHEHSRDRVLRQHRGEVRTTNLDDCIRCHQGGREHGEGGGDDD